MSISLAILDKNLIIRQKNGEVNLMVETAENSKGPWRKNGNDNNDDDDDDNNNNDNNKFVTYQQLRPYGIFYDNQDPVI